MNSILVHDSEGFVHLIADEPEQDTRPKLYKLYCSHCGCIIVTNDISNNTYFDGKEEIALCSICIDEIAASWGISAADSSGGRFFQVPLLADTSEPKHNPNRGIRKLVWRVTIFRRKGSKNFCAASPSTPFTDDTTTRQKRFVKGAFGKNFPQ